MKVAAHYFKKRKEKKTSAANYENSFREAQNVRKIVRQD